MSKKQLFGEDPTEEDARHIGGNATNPAMMRTMMTKT